MEKYVAFICSEIPKEMHTEFVQPNVEQLARFIHKIGPRVTEKVEITILETYTRSAKIKITFDKYENESIYYMSRHKGPDNLLNEIQNKIQKIVNETFINDNRLNYIIDKYLIAQAYQTNIINNITKSIKL